MAHLFLDASRTIISHDAFRELPSEFAVSSRMKLNREAEGSPGTVVKRSLICVYL